MHGERSMHLYKGFVLQEIKEPELWDRRDKTLALAQAEMGTTTDSSKTAVISVHGESG
jgi:hypothetical protein